MKLEKRIDSLTLQEAIQLILAGLQRHMLDIHFTAQKFLDRVNQILKPINRACDFVYHSLHTSGIGTSVQVPMPLVCYNSRRRAEIMGL